MNLLLVIAMLFSLTGDHWQFDFEQAKVEAATQGKHVLIYFSGSDWCKPCIQLKSEVMEDPTFLEFANEEFVMVLADFPRRKKNKLTDAQTAHNEALAEKYNLQGYFPLIVVTDHEGNVVGRTGFERIGVEDYIKRFTEMLHGS